MSAVANVVSELRSIANSEELELIGLLLSDSCVATAICERNHTMLARVFGVSVLSYEDEIKDRFGVVFRNYGRQFEIVRGKVGTSLLKVEDDILGTIGASIVTRAMARDNYRLGSYYLAGKRCREDLDILAENVDRVGIRNALPTLRTTYPETTKCVRTIEGMDTSYLNLELPSKCTDEGRELWTKYLSAVTTLFTQLRTNPGPICVRDERATGSAVTVGDLVKNFRESEGKPIRPTQGTTFTEAENSMIVLLGVEGLEIVDVEGAQRMVRTQRDVFEYIASSFVAPVEIPDWTQPAEQQPAPPSLPASPARCAASPSQHAPPSAGFSLLHDYHAADLNKFKDVRTKLVGGGLSEEAQRVWAGLSKAKRSTFLRPLDSTHTLDEATELVAREHGIVDDLDVVCEVLASRLVLSKNAFRFKFDRSGGVEIERV